MSYRLVDLIKKSKTIPGVYKRTLEAWASFARKDGTNCFPSKEAVAARAGVSRWTVYRHTNVFLVKGILVPYDKHTYPNGHWTTVYRIDEEALKNAVWRENDDADAVLQDATDNCSKMPLRHCSKTPKSLCSKTPTTSVARDDAKGDISTVALLPVINEASAPTPAWPKAEASKQGSKQDDLAVLGRSVRPFESSGSAAQMETRPSASGSPVPPPVVITVPDQPESSPAKRDEPSFWSDRLQRTCFRNELDCQLAERLYRAAFKVHPQDEVPHEELRSFLEVMLDFGGRYDNQTKLEHVLPLLLLFNRVHKKGKLLITSASKLARSYWSDSPDSLRRQFEQHAMGCDLCRKALEQLEAEAEAAPSLLPELATPEELKQWLHEVDKHFDEAKTEGDREFWRKVWLNSYNSYETREKEAAKSLPEEEKKPEYCPVCEIEKSCCICETCPTCGAEKSFGACALCG